MRRGGVKSMSERFVPCLMKPTKSCEPSCPNYNDAEGLRDRLEKALAKKAGRQVTDEEIQQECARINPLIPVLTIPDRIANTCPHSHIRKVEIRPFA